LGCPTLRGFRRVESGPKLRRVGGWTLKLWNPILAAKNAARMEHPSVREREKKPQAGPPSITVSALSRDTSSREGLDFPLVEVLLWPGAPGLRPGLGRQPGRPFTSNRREGWGPPRAGRFGRGDSEDVESHPSRKKTRLGWGTLRLERGRRNRKASRPARHGYLISRLGRCGIPPSRKERG
jgi:hypothetical protein